ncbi:MAG: DUF1294 domain-containing protein [Aristaeellaceae bacterium]
MMIVGLFLAGMNLLSFTLMGVDKRRARQGRWRIPERTLFLVTALFGGLGGVLGMRVFHHKTRHRSFRLGFPALLMAQLAVLAAAGYFLRL